MILDILNVFFVVVFSYLIGKNTNHPNPLPQWLLVWYWAQLLLGIAFIIADITK